MQQEHSFTTESLKKAYLKLVNDIEYDQLELLKKDATFFQIIGASKAELRHSNFLAWLLDPQASHGLGEDFLKRFVREIASDLKATSVSEIEVEQLDFSKVKVLREWQNIDILIEFESLAFIVENKILSGEHSNQLSKYKKIADKEFKSKKLVFAYLTPTGTESIDERDFYVAISYDVIVSILERIITVKGNFVGANARIYITDYIKTLKREVMQTDETIDLARSIYKNHKELLDFIFEYKPDYREPLKAALQKQLNLYHYIEASSSVTYLRFLTGGLSKVIPINQINQGWKGRESFLFEFILGSEKYIVFQGVISPGPYSDSLKEIIMEVDGAKEPPGKKWLTFFKTKLMIKNWNFHELEESDIELKVSEFMVKINPIVSKIEKHLVANKERIRK